MREFLEGSVQILNDLLANWNHMNAHARKQAVSGARTGIHFAIFDLDEQENIARSEKEST